MKRKTTQRQAIARSFRRAGRPLTPQEALDGAQKLVPTLGIATVYRAIKDMVDIGTLKAVELPGEAARYELAELDHHHHFHCRTCDRVFDVPGCADEVEQLAPPGFEAEDHEIVIYGRCDQCNKI